MIKNKLPKEPFVCKMCKKHTVGKHPYTYKTYEFPGIPSTEFKICEKCAKREHGTRNKKPLPE